MDSQQVWQQTPLVGFDTETTGTDPRSERIISASLVLRNSPSAGEDQHVRSWLIDPGVEIPAASTAVHGMSTEYVRVNGTDPVDTLPQIANALVQAVNDGAVIVIFNASYDLTILESELARHGLATLRDLLEGKAAPVFDPLFWIGLLCRGGVVSGGCRTCYPITAWSCRKACTMRLWTRAQPLIWLRLCCKNMRSSMSYCPIR